MTQIGFGPEGEASAGSRDQLPKTESTAARVRSSESGQRWLYVSKVSAAEASLKRLCTVFTLSPKRISRDAPPGKDVPFNARAQAYR